MRCLPGQAGATRLGTIPGMVPAMIGGSDGCSFAPRCAYASEPCRQGRKALHALDPSHSYRCLLPAQESLEHLRKASA